jgi:hypothetical protein
VALELTAFFAITYREKEFLKIYIQKLHGLYGIALCFLDDFF